MITEVIKTVALYILLTILTLFFLIGMIKVSVVIAYSDNLLLYAKVFFVKIKLIPKKEPKRIRRMSRAKAQRIKKKLEKKAQKKKLEEKEKAKEEKAEGKGKKSPRDIISIIQTVATVSVAVIKRFAKHLRIKIAKINLVVASDDAASTAIIYGAVCQSINVLMPVLEDVKNFKNLKNADITVDCDFGSTEPKIDIKLEFSIRVWQILNIVIGAFIAFVKHKIRSDEKAQAPTTTTNDNKK